MPEDFAVIYKAGQSAFWQGKKASENPYSGDGQVGMKAKRTAWENGYYAASETARKQTKGRRI